jgi:16S rRNA (guanine966-N2)-methyltransferase
MRILAGEFKGHSLPTLEGDGCRPAMAKVREAVFSMLDARGFGMPGARVLDVFAGTGSLGFEALSRGADQVCFLERNRALARRIEENCRRLSLARRRASVLVGDALAVLAKPPAGVYDVAFVDPPYGQDLLAPCLALLAAKGWLASPAAVVAEAEKRLNLNVWPESFTMEADRAYGQTRICIWSYNIPPQPSIQAPSTP